MPAMPRGGSAREPGDSVEIVILTVIPVELEAVCRVLGLTPDSRELSEDQTAYFCGTARSELVGRDYTIAVTCIGRPGNPAAAAATANAIARYQPRAAFLVGIAAGIRGKVQIGEVVISDRVVAYEPAALVASSGGSRVEPRPDIDVPPHAMAQCLTGYRPEAWRVRRVFNRAGGEIPGAPRGQKTEFKNHVASAVIAKRGTIASGEKLLRDPALLVAVREHHHGKVEVGEMEAAGFVAACRPAQLPWLVIRGISDFGDDLKDDRFQAFASQAAAAVLRDFLAHGLELPGADKRAPAQDAPNPFIFGRAIDRDDDLIGRDDERRWLREAIDKGQPVQLLGERLMGKSSLLRWVQRSVSLDRVAVRLDPSRGITAVSMVQSLARAVGETDAAASLDGDAPAARAVEVLHALGTVIPSSGRPFALLVDDADALISRGDGFGDGLFETLRGLIQDRKLTWVSASVRDLHGTHTGGGLTSRFLNDSARIFVGALSKRAARDLASRGLGNEVVARVIEAAGGFAHGLQWLGDFLCRRPGEIDHACDAFADDIEPTFAVWWAGIDERERPLVKRCVHGDVAVGELDDPSRRRLRGLKARGLVAEHDGRFVIHGKVWRDFVSNAR